MLFLRHTALDASVQVRPFQMSRIVFALTQYFSETLALFPFIWTGISFRHDSKLVGAKKTSFSLYISAASLPLRIALGLGAGMDKFRSDATQQIHKSSLSSAGVGNSWPQPHDSKCIHFKTPRQNTKFVQILGTLHVQIHANCVRMIIQLRRTERPARMGVSVSIAWTNRVVT